MNYRRTFFAAACLTLAVAPSAYGQLRAWKQTAPTPSVAAPAGLPKPTVSGVRPVAAGPSAPRLLPTASIAPQPSPTMSPAMMPQQTSVSQPMMPTAVPVGGASSPYVAPYFTAQAPTPAPPLGGTTVPAPVIAPSIVGTPPTFTAPALAAPSPQPSYTFSTPAPAASGWSGGLPANEFSASPPPINAPPSYPPLSSGAPPMGIEPSPNFAAPPSMGSSCDPQPPYDPGVYDPGAVWEDPGVRDCGPWFFSAAFLMLTRDAPNNVGLAYLQNQPQITVLNSETAGSHSWEPGGEIRFGRALADRWAVEGVYWAADTFYEQIGIHRTNNDINTRFDFENVLFQGSPLTTVFDNSRDQRFLRSDTFENIEINVMQQALQVDPAGTFGLTSFLGARYFRFDEITHLEATAAGVDYGTVPDSSPSYSDYRVTMHNRMIGAQIGARGTLNLGCFRLFAIPRFGLFANNISMKQHVCRVINLHSEKVDVTLLGQLDVGVSYQILPCVSIFGSYRGQGFAGVATADDNLARSFEAVGDLESIQSGGSLILHGWQVGVQTQF